MSTPGRRGRSERTRRRGMRRTAGRLRSLARLVTVVLTGMAVAQELRKPADRRRWHGVVAGYVPYDFRRPTADRYRSRVWAPADPRVLVPQAFGVGWTLNLGRLLTLLRGRR